MELSVEARVNGTYTVGQASDGQGYVELFDSPPGRDGRRDVRIRDLGRAVSRAPFDSSVATISLVDNGWDGYDGVTPAFDMVTVQDVAETNYRSDTISAVPGYGPYYMNHVAGTGMTKGFDLEFAVEGTYLGIIAPMLFAIPGYTYNANIFVDDMPMKEYRLNPAGANTLVTAPFTTHASVGLNTINVKFPQRGFHTVRFSGVGILLATGVAVTNQNNIVRKPQKRRTFIQVSDSFGEGSHSTIVASADITQHLGMVDWNCSEGGTGFLNPGISGQDHSYSSDFIFNMIRKAPKDAAFLWLNGTANDLSYTDDQVVEGMRKFFARWRAERGKTPIFWSGIEPMSYFVNIYGIEYIKARESLMAEVAAADPNVIGMALYANERWFTGTGKVNAPVGDGNQDFTVGNDGVHLSHYGIRYWAKMIAERMLNAYAYVEGRQND